MLLKGELLYHYHHTDFPVLTRNFGRHVDRKYIQPEPLCRQLHYLLLCPFKPIFHLPPAAHRLSAGHATAGPPVAAAGVASGGPPTVCYLGTILMKCLLARSILEIYLLSYSNDMFVLHVTMYTKCSSHSVLFSHVTSKVRTCIINYYQ